MPTDNIKRRKSLIRRRIAGAYVSSVASISLVLFLIGMGSLVLINAERVSRYFRESVGVSVMFHTEVSEAQAETYASSLASEPFVRSCEIVSREQGRKEMAALLGEDFLTVFETSPVPVSLNLTLTSEYMQPDSLAGVETVLAASPLVDDVVYQKSLVESLNSNLRKIGLVAGAFIALLLFISVVLISNTMRLTVYDRRFTIHTMKLVGATRGFIMRPFLGKAALLGLISALVAVAMMAGVLYFIRRELVQLFDMFSLEAMGIAAAVTLLAGLVLCSVSTVFVVRRLLGMGRDDLYY